MRLRLIFVGCLIGALTIAGCSSGDDTTEASIVETTEVTTTTAPPLDVQAHAEGLLVGIRSEGDFLELDSPGTISIGVGSGVVIAEDGLILTSATSVIGADRINVYIPGEEFPLVGELDAAVECANIALVRVDHTFTQTAAWSEDSLPTSVASANKANITSGSIGTTGSGDHYALSGGPIVTTGAALFDDDGGLVGIVTGYTDTGQPVALGSNEAESWIDRMRSRDVVEQLGFTAVSNTEGQAVVASVADTGPGSNLGLGVGDIVITADGVDLVAGLGQLCGLIDDGEAELEVIKEGRRHVGIFPGDPLILASSRTTEQIRRAVVEIRTDEDSRGTGFFISEDGLVVTNYHVVGAYDELLLRFDGSADTIPAKVIGASACADIAVLQASGGSFEYLEWAPDPPKLEEPVRVVGFPNRTDTISFQDGAVAKEVADDIEWFGFLTNFETSAKTDGGNSGSPVVNTLGEILGVHYASEEGNIFVIRNPRHLMGIEARQIVASIVDGTLVDPGFQANIIHPDDLYFYDKTLDGVTGLTVEIESIRAGGPGAAIGLELYDEIVIFGEALPQSDISGFRMICEATAANGGNSPIDVVIWRYTDGYLWDGQLYGSALSQRPDPYYLATDDGTIGVTVPGRWVDKEDIDIEGNDWIGYWASIQLDDAGGYFDLFGKTPGMRLMWSYDKAETHTTTQHLEGLGYATNADGPIVAFSDFGLIGHYQRYDFGGSSAIEYAFTLDGLADSPLFMLFVADANHRLDTTVARMLRTVTPALPSRDVEGEG